MRFLFVHQNFPGQYLHLLRELAANPEHEVTFLSTANTNAMTGVRRVDYRPIQASTPGVHFDAREFETAMIRAASVAGVAAQLARIGYRPDIVFGHNGWGEVLNLRDVWRDVPIVPYFEFYYHDHGLDVDFDPEFPISEVQRSTIRARNAVNLLGLEIAAIGQTPTLFQQRTYPDWARPRVRVLPEGVNLSVCKPDPKASFTLPGASRRWTRRGARRLVTYVARNLEPYRGFHIFMRSLPTPLAARPDVDVVVAGGDSVSYGPVLPPGQSWRQRMLDELGARLPDERVFFTGRLEYDQYVSLLQTSSVHVYLTYPFVASWSLREALACGCTVVGSQTAPVAEFIEDERNGTLVPFHSPSGLAERILDLLEDAPRRRRLGQAARSRAQAEFQLETQSGCFWDLVYSLGLR